MRGIEGGWPVQPPAVRQYTRRKAFEDRLPAAMPKAKKPSADSEPKRPAKGDAAFDIWLKRGLQKIYGEVANEPVPEELLKLIEEDRNR
jgi:hypothetical protein